MSEPQTPESLLLTFVADRDVLCPLCKYNLRNMTRPQCPECGENLVLQVGAAEPKLGLWLLMTVPLISGAGLGCLVVNALLRFPTQNGNAIYWMVGFILCIPFAAAAIALRRRFNTAPRKVRSILAWGSLAFVVILFSIVLLRSR